MSDSPTAPEPQDAVPGPPAKTVKSRRRRWRSRLIALLVVAVAVAVVGAYGLTRAPERFGLPLESSKTLDTDGDGLLDDVEEAGWVTQDGTEYRTDPESADTDGDGLTDSDEAGELVSAEPTAEGSEEVDDEEPSEQASGAVVEDVYAGYSNPLEPDTDGDELEDGDEADLGLDPFDTDSDDDELEDGREVNLVGTSPAVADTDGDGFDDGYEDANIESQGLDPLLVDVKVSKMSYATDFAIGAVAGDAWRKDSLAWLAGNLTSTGSSSIPVIGWVVGPLVDARDAIASLIRMDWVGAGFSAVSAVPYAGDAVAIPGKAAKFVARNPELAATVAAAIVAIKNVPEKIKIEAAQQVFKHWDELRDAGISEKTLLQLSKGKLDLDALADAIRRPTHVPGPSAPFFADGYKGEEWLENLHGAKTKGVDIQVSMSTKACTDTCNPDHRIFDVLVDGVAHESKVGYKVWSEELAKQIRSDAYLIKTGQIEGAHWHFMASVYNNKVGADPKVLDLLDELGIPYTIHLPA